MVRVNAPTGGVVDAPTVRLDPRWQHVRSQIHLTSSEIDADEHADLVIEMIQKRGVDPWPP